MSIKTTAILCLVSAVLAAAMTRYYFPSIKTETLTVDHDVIHNNIVTVTHTVKEPNGTVDTTTTTTDHTQQNITQTDVSKKTRDLEWNISGLAGVDIKNRSGPDIFGFSVTRQILGPLTVGVFGLTNSTIGISMGVNF